MLFALAFTISVAINAQLQKSFAVSDNQEFDRVKFSLNATHGQCFIEPSLESHLMDIWSDASGAGTPRYKEQIVNRTKQVEVHLTDDENSAFGASFSSRMLSLRPPDEYTWKVYLPKLKPLDLDLNYAVGDSYIDLSDLPIQKLRMRSGSAHVKVNYNKGMGNKIEMDTFLIKVDLGTFEAKNLHLCNSSNIITDVGFGRVKMDFGDADDVKTDVKATVGAGRLEILLPGKDVPVKININDSPLCHIKIPKEFKKTGDHVFVSPDFNENEACQMNFTVDVAVGNIVFKSAGP